MFKSWWFNLMLGLMIGLAVGYVLAEMQPVPPAKALIKGMERAAAGDAMPPGHPPVEAAATGGDQGSDAQLREQAAQLEKVLRERPGDPDILTALGNLYFDAGRWEEARKAYEGALESRPDDPNVLTDLAVAYRNLRRPDRALELLRHATEVAPDHWQALYNEVVVLHFDLHRHDEAKQALARLRKLKESNPQVPDLRQLEQEIEGGH
jgi:tetratricopeptide (TPR) repeat protein